LPKTRTGKIMRRLLKSKLLGMPLGDLSSLENPVILDEIPKLG
jgi:acetyl-CoA synthetase